VNFTTYFTPAEATRTLPLVKRIVRDILALGQKMKQEHAEGVEVSSAEIKQVRDYMQELEALGCFYKDWNMEIGLVDFPCLMSDGEEVFLCWRSDEEKLEWYHPVEAGYAGRTRIPEEMLQGVELDDEAHPDGAAGQAGDRPDDEAEGEEHDQARTR